MRILRKAQLRLGLCRDDSAPESPPNRPARIDPLSYSSDTLKQALFGGKLNSRTYGQTPPFTRKTQTSCGLFLPFNSTVRFSSFDLSTPAF